jgi:hypothetical protein
MIPEVHVSTARALLVAATLFLAFESVASAQTIFTGSIGNVFGGAAPSTKNTWAIAIGGIGAHGIGSELEFSETRNFFETSEGVAYGKILTLIPSIFFAVPVGRVHPYGIFGFGFIRQRTQSSVGGVLSNLSDSDVGYSIGGGVTYRFARSAGVRGDLRRFKVRTANGLTFHRFTVGLVVGG